MRPPASIKPYLTQAEMFLWLQQSPDPAAYRRRLAISLTDGGQLNAAQVAKVLGASTQAVRLWIKQYNTYGPEGLRRQGRGGRRWAFLSQQDEAELIQQAKTLTQKPSVSLVPTLQELINHKLQRNVSRSYVYRLLKRHGGLRRTRSTEPSQTSPITTLANRSQFLRQVLPWRRER
ncbi:MAG: helix-turn-helix domain-containing protein [Sedimentisphaerales bacterium]|nr:helix-turn-helix domain-containing protein [Sedimentisphaerales bacterium]